MNTCAVVTGWHFHLDAVLSKVLCASTVWKTTCVCVLEKEKAK